MLLMTGVIFLASSIWWRSGPVMRHIRGRWKMGAIGGACSFFSYGLALWAMTCFYKKDDFNYFD